MCQWCNKRTQCIIGIAPQFKTICVQKLPLHSCSWRSYFSRWRIGCISNNSIPECSQVSAYLVSATSYWLCFQKYKLTLSGHNFYISLGWLSTRSDNTTSAIIRVALQRTIQHEFVFSIERNISQRARLQYINFILSFHDHKRRARSCPIWCSTLRNSQVSFNNTMLMKLANEVTP